MSIHPSLRTGRDLLRLQDEQKRKPLLPTGLLSFDRLLGGGLARGRLIELVGGRSSGRAAITFAALSAATRRGETTALIDLGDHLDPRAAQAAGVDLTRLLWVRPRHLQESLLAAEMVLTSGLGLVVLDLGLAPTSLRRLSDGVWRRLAWAAEAQGNILLLLASTPLAGGVAGVVLKSDNARAVWRRDGGAPPLLGGIASQLRVLRRQGGEPVASRDPLALGVREGTG